MIFKKSALVLSLISVFALSACEGMKRHGRGDSGMRIQVDVYKGPLALDPELQWGRLLGYLRESNTALDHYIKITMEHLRKATDNELPSVGSNHPIDICKLKDRYYWKGGKRVSNPKRLLGQIPRELDLKREKKQLDKAKNLLTKSENNDLVESGSWGYIFDSPVTKRARENLAEAQRTYDKASKRIDKITEQASQQVYLVQLLLDACEAWSFVDKTQGAALHWTEVYDKYRVASRQAMTLLNRSVTRSERAANAHSGKYVIYDKITNQPEDVEDPVIRDRIKGILKDVPAQRSALRGILARFGEIGARMKGKAAYWAWSHANTAHPDIQMRQLALGLSLIMSEYSNRVVSAADALLKQTYIADRRELPISDLIRDTQPTHIANQLIFNGVMSPPLPHENWRVDYRYDRMRTIEQIYADESWSNINQAYASGSGDVTMAFIKDDVGNWNLKSFDQDPTEVVNTYKNLGLSAIKTATNLVSGGSAEGLSQAQRLLALGNQLTMGGTGNAVAPEATQINLLRSSTVLQLKQLAEEADIKQKVLSASLTRVTTAIEGTKDIFGNVTAKGTRQVLEEAVEAHRNATDMAIQNGATDEEIKEVNARLGERESAVIAHRNNEVELADVKAKLAALPKEITAKAIGILDNYAQIVSSMQQGLLVKKPGVLPEFPKKIN